MASSDTSYQFESFNGFSAVTLLPELNKVSWADIDKIGTALVGRVEAQSNPILLVDLKSLTYMGSAMVALVVRIWKSVKDRNGKMAVVSSDAMVLEVLTLAGLAKVWQIVDSREEGLKTLGVSSKQMRAEGFTPPVSTGADEGRGKMAAVCTSLLMAVSAVGLFLLLKPQDFVKDGRVVTGLLFGGGLLAMLAATATASVGHGWKRGFGVLALLAAMGICGAGIANTPKLKNLFDADEKDKPQQESGGSSTDGKTEKKSDGPAEARRPASLTPKPEPDSSSGKPGSNPEEGLPKPPGTATPSPGSSKPIAPPSGGPKPTSGGSAQTKTNAGSSSATVPASKPKP